MLSNPRKNLWLAGGAFVLVAATIGFFAVRAASSSGVSYNGKPLEYWFSQTPIMFVSTNGSADMVLNIPIRPHGEGYGCCLEKDDDVKRAFWSMGTNCLPFLVRKLGGHKTRVSWYVIYWQHRLGIKRIPADKDIERGQAIVALKWMDPLPMQTCEKIQALSKCKNPEVAAAAKEALSECHELKP
jgi:hypothetical protein